MSSELTTLKKEITDISAASAEVIDTDVRENNKGPKENALPVGLLAALTATWFGSAFVTIALAVVAMPSQVSLSLLRICPFFLYNYFLQK